MHPRENQPSPQTAIPILSQSDRELDAAVGQIEQSDDQDDAAQERSF